MTSKNWTRLAIAFSLLLVGAIVLFQSWSPLSVAPQRPGPETNPPQEKIPSQKQAQKASSITSPEDSDMGSVLTARAGSERADDPNQSPKAASRLKELSKEAPQEVATAESLKSTAPSKSTPIAQARETFGDPTLDPLIRDTDDQDWKVRWDAVNELGKLKDPRAIPALVDRALYDDNSHPRWRSLWALKAVDRTGSEAIPSLRSALQDPDEVVVRNAAVALAFFGQPEARSELLKGLDDYDTYRRWEAIFSLRKIGNPEVAEALVPLLNQGKEPEVGIRSEIALTLGYMGSQEAIWPLLNALSGDPSPQVRWRAALTLSRMGNSSLIQEQLEQNLATEQDPKVIEHIKDALTEIRKR